MEVAKIKAYIEESDELTMSKFTNEQQLKRKNYFKKKEESSISNNKEHMTKLRQKGKNNSNSNSSTSSSTSIKCFKCLGMGHIDSQCPNKIILIIKDGFVMTESEIDSSPSYPSSSSKSED